MDTEFRLLYPKGYKESDQARMKSYDFITSLQIDDMVLLLKNRSPNQRNVCKFPRIALVSFNRGLYAPAQSRNQLQRFGFVHLVQIGNDHIEIE